MTLFRVVGLVLLAGFISLPVYAQQSSSSSDSSVQTSSSKNEQSQDEAAPRQDQNPPSEQTIPENTKKESTIKRKAKELIPACIGIAGGAGKCSHSADEQEQARKEEQEDQLRRQCRQAAELSQQESPSCADLRKRDAAHDLDVGDTYFEEKSYGAAASRYRSTLQEDPANATAMLHYAEALEKLGRKAEAYQQYQKYLNTNPQGSDAERARKAVEHLQPSASKSK